MQILVPISGYSAFFPKEDFYFPKPLIEIAGKPMIELVITELKKHFSEAQFIFVVDAWDSTSFSLDKTLRLLAGEDTCIVEKPGSTSGALCSCLLAVDKLDLGGELVVANSDQVIFSDLQGTLEEFRSKSSDAGVISFESVHPRWSYIIEDGGVVTQAIEKRVISRHAIAGFYYFKTAAQFIDSAQAALEADASTDGAFYISAIINEVILGGGKVVHKKIDRRDYCSFYSPVKIDEFERSSYARDIRGEGGFNGSACILIPAAGKGSRFMEKGWRRPKPFIDVGGISMINRVIDNVSIPQARVVVILQEEHRRLYPNEVRSILDSGVDIDLVTGLTEGTACTALFARKRYEEEGYLIIANSDQIVDLDMNEYVKDCKERDLDGSIVVFKEETLDPKWSYVRLDEEGLVIEVAEKKLISNLATAGIYMFSQGKDFTHAAIDMIAANERVNGEFYTCPVYNHMISNGARIGVFEVSQDAMHGLGTPGDLADFLEARGYSMSIDDPKNRV